MVAALAKTDDMKLFCASGVGVTVASRFGDAKAKSGGFCATEAGAVMVASGFGDTDVNAETFCCAAADRAASKITPTKADMYRVSFFPRRQQSPDVPIFNLSNELSGCL